MHTNYDIKFDVGALIDHMGGVPAVAALLKEIGLPIKAKTLQKQRERGNIPADVIATLMYAADKSGKPFNPYAFLIERDTSEEGN